MQDELVWGATWLYKATNTPDYWNYVRNNIVGDITEFGWDSKHAGINVLVSQVKLLDQFLVL